jgi:hypothetical protein
VHQLLVTTKIVPISPIFVTLMMEMLHSSKMMVLTRATHHNIPEDGILNKYLIQNFTRATFNFNNVQLFSREDKH